MIPLLHVRTEHTYRQVYGPVDLVAARLKEVVCPFAACVDFDGTWGHVHWAKALKKEGVTAAFGAEFALRNEEGKAPRAWALATELKAFYNWTSSGPTTPEHWERGQGLIRFAGQALTDPALFDYVDLDCASIIQARKGLALAKTTARPTVLAPVNDYPAPAHRDRFLAWADNQKMTIQHIPSQQELRAAYHWLTDAEFKKALHGTQEVAERIGALELNKAPLISVPGDLTTLVKKGKARRIAAGQLKGWDDVYEKRLQRELKLIKEKKFESYFIVVSDLVVWAKKHMLVGPARGSSAGSLVCYLLAITEVDPIPFGLLFERFIDINRNDLPDIDIDFAEQQPVFDYLTTKYGTANVARIGNINRLQARSVVAHVCKKLGINHGATFPVLNVLIEYSSGDSRYGKGLEDTLNNTQPGKDFMAKYPEAALMGELEGHASHTGVHAAGVIVSNEPVTNYCTVRDGIAQIHKYEAEELNLLKIDALGLRTLAVIQDTGCISNEELYSLELNDKKVFKIFNDKKFSGLFQFEGAAQRRVSIQVPVTSFQQIDHVTALARPGPLGGGASGKYINRNAGREKTTYLHPSMEEYLADTFGVVLYQEQVMRIVREIGDFSWEETTVIRKAMSGRKGVEFFDQKGAQFVKGAKKHGIDQDTAKKIWNEICSFGAWGMNKSHTCSYAIISYWCGYMKQYHPIQYAAALMRNAKDAEQIMETLRELAAEGIKYIPFDPRLSEADWSAKGNKLIGGFNNLFGVGPVTAQKYLQKRNTVGLTHKDLEKLKGMQVRYSDLSPAHTLWKDIYDNPDNYNIHGPVKEFANLSDMENCVVVCKIVKKERRDENEAVRAARRGGELKSGQTQFLDVFVVDDSVSKSVLLRIKPRLWDQYGQTLADKAVDNKDWFLVRGKWLAQFSMLSVERIKCLTQPEMFQC